MVIGFRMSPVALSMAGYANGKFDLKSLIVASVVIYNNDNYNTYEKIVFKINSYSCISYFRICSISNVGIC